MTDRPITDALKQAYQFIRQGQFDAAIQRLQQVIRTAPGDARAFELLGVAQAQAGDVSAAAMAFRKATAIDPGNAAGWRNLGNALLRNHEEKEAIEAFEKALRLDPDTVDVLYNLAIAHRNLKHTGEARDALQRLLRAQAGHADAWSMLGHLEQAEENFDAALAHYDRCLAIDPRSLVALMGKSMICNDRKQYETASELSRKVIRLNPRISDVHKNLGDSYMGMGNIDQAIDAYTTAVNLEPLDGAHHHRLNQTLWVEGRPGFLDSYERVLESNPQAHSLRRELVYKLIKVDRLEEAEQHILRLTKQESSHAMNHQLHGGVLRKRRQFDEAISAHRQAVLLAPDSKVCKQELATSLLANWEAAAALSLLEQLCAADELHQGYIALRATALRMLGSEEYPYLFDYDRLVLKTEIEPPPGYETIRAFNQDLKDYLHTLHVSKEHPLDQSLVNGTQTIDDLFDDSHELISLLKASFDQQTRRFLQQLPVDAHHPALSRNSHKFSHSSAWSVLLRSSGFHVNHFHDRGWYSGPYYVDLPGVIGDENDKQGWIKFGEPGFECVQPLPPDLVVRPEPGLMIRFPSYMWHGTVPFESDQKRLVVSLDINPA